MRILSSRIHGGDTADAKTGPMRAIVVALVSLVAFAGIGAAAVTLLPDADSEPLHPIQVNAPQLQPRAPAPSGPAPAATPPPASAPPLAPPPGAPAPAPRTQAGLRDVPEPPPPLVGNDDGDDDWDDDWGDDDDGDD